MRNAITMNVYNIISMICSILQSQNEETEHKFK